MELPLGAAWQSLQEDSQQRPGCHWSLLPLCQAPAFPLLEEIFFLKKIFYLKFLFSLCCPLVFRFR